MRSHLLVVFCLLLSSGAFGAEEAWTPDKTQPLRLALSNRAARLTIVNGTLTDHYGATPAPAGRQWLVLTTEWENTFPLELAGDKAVSIAYSVPSVADHLYVVVNGRQAARVAKNAETMAGHLPRQITLKHPGATLRGNLVFDLPAGEIHSLELRFYDYAHGHMRADLIKPAVASPEAQPIGPLQKNQVLEAGIYSFKKADQYAGSKAPDGMTFILVEMRARSLVMLDGDATAFDPKAAKGARMRIGTVADWKESRTYVQAVVDGVYAHMPLDTSELAHEPRFLPDVMTGGEVAFCVPAKCESLELRCDFPNAAIPGITQPIRPDGMLFTLQGKRPPPAERIAIVSVADLVYRVAVVGQKVADQFAGQPAGPRQRFVILDVTVANVGTKGEFFQTFEQLKLVNAAGKQTNADSATSLSPSAAVPLLWIPPAEQRTFQVVYRVPDSESRLWLAFRGVTLAKALPLNPIGDGPAIGPVSGPATAPVIAARVADQAEPPRVPARQNRKPGGLASVGLTAEDVNEAIDKGAEWLWKQRQAAMRGGKLSANVKEPLYLLALVNAGAHKRFPEMDAAVRDYLAHPAPNNFDVGGYEAGVICMLVEAYADPTFLPRLRRSTRYLLEAQGPRGSWAYKVELPEAIYSVLPPATEPAPMPAFGPSSRDSAAGAVWRRTTDWSKGIDGDNSVSQFGLLGLHSASRCGLRIDPEVWRRNLAELRARHDLDGGWAYTPARGRNNSYGSMTAAGICGVAINRFELGERSPAEDQDIEEALGWLAAHFTVEVNPGATDNHHYYLYSLERVGQILDTEFIGPHEWYPEGARYLVSRQHADGSWVPPSGSEDGLLATSFALLFLTRATPTLMPSTRPAPRYADTRPVTRPAVTTAPVVVIRPVVTTAPVVVATKPVVVTPPVVVATRPVMTTAPIVVIATKPVVVPPPVVIATRPVMTTAPVVVHREGVLRTTANAARPQRCYIILDASGSMLEEMDGKTKFDVARDAVAAMIKELPATSEVALRVYGHRKSAIDDGADEDTALEIRMGPLDRAKFMAKLDSLRARGKTPLALSLRQTAADLGRDTEPTTVILLTDGGEDTLPRQDPLKAADQLAALKHVKVDVLGFDIGRQDWQEELAALTRRAGGQYWPAPKAEQLRASLRSVALGGSDEFTLLGKDGKNVGSGKFGDSKTLAPGRYVLRSSMGDTVYEADVTIVDGGTAIVAFSDTKPVATVGRGTTDPPAARFCSHCGKAVAAGAKFCTSCGAKVGD